MSFVVDTGQLEIAAVFINTYSKYRHFVKKNIVNRQVEDLRVIVGGEVFGLFPDIADPKRHEMIYKTIAAFNCFVNDPFF